MGTGFTPAVASAVVNTDREPNARGEIFPLVHNPSPQWDYLDFYSGDASDNPLHLSIDQVVDTYLGL
jgi:hypothetical protein